MARVIRFKKLGSSKMRVDAISRRTFSEFLCGGVGLVRRSRKCCVIESQTWLDKVSWQ